MEDGELQVRWNELVSDLAGLTSRKTLAERIGVSDKEIRRWVRGEARPQGEHARALLKECDECCVSWKKYARFTPVYDFRSEYNENLHYGPQGLPSKFESFLPRIPTQLLGNKLNSPLGVPSSVLTISSKWIEPLTKLGFDIITYKTCRTRQLPAHPFPNVAYLPDLCEPMRVTLLPESTRGVLSPPHEDVTKISLANSFGMPSPDPTEWQADLDRTLKLLQPGQMLIVSVVGTVSSPGEDLAADFAKCASLANEVGPHAIELNFSCPNVYTREEGFIYQDADLAGRIVTRIRSAMPTAKIIIKIGYLTRDKLAELFERTYRYVDGFTAINTLPIEVLSEGQLKEPVFTGSNRVKPGVSGAAIRDCALETVRNLRKAAARRPELVILGVGGVSAVEHVTRLLEAGASGAQICSAALINPFIGAEIRKQLGSQQAANTQSRYLSRAGKSITFSDPVLREAFDSLFEACDESQVAFDRGLPIFQKRWLNGYLADLAEGSHSADSPGKTRRSAPTKAQVKEWLCR